MPQDVPHVADPALYPVRDRVLAGQSLTLEDGLALYASRDLHGIGRLAHHVRTRLHGPKVYYNRNRHINYTNVCALSCKFCSFHRKRGEEGAYEMPVDQVVHIAQGAAASGATEVHIVGGLHPWRKFDYYLDMLRGIRQACPQLHLKAFTAIEIVHFTRIARLSIAEVLVALRDAGLGSLPGGGAEIFDERVHAEAFKGKVGANKWFEVHRTAHALGIPSNVTMLYGHVETIPERVKHLIALRQLQAESLANMSLPVQSCQLPDTFAGAKSTDDSSTHDSNRRSNSYSIPLNSATVPVNTTTRSAFNCVVPLSFIPEGSELGYLPRNTGLGDLKTLAITRLMVDNIPHIKAFWIMQGIHLAQLALDWGCDDLDGTVVWYDITKRKEHEGNHQELHLADIHRVAREAGKVAIERDTLYRQVRRDPATDQLISYDELVTSA